MENNEDWLDLKTVPKNASWFNGLTKRNTVVRCHYASDLSGEEQPPFQGFFRDGGGYFTEVEIKAWRPEIKNQLKLDLQ